MDYAMSCKEWFVNNAMIIATFLLALVTFLLALFAFLTWAGQIEYYEKTTRPFVFAKEPSFVKASQNNDNLYYITYKVENVGSLPGKNVILSSFLNNKKQTKLITLTPKKNDLKQNVEIIYIIADFY